MTSRKITLEIIQVANPCTQDWEGMRGDDQVRFCGVCEKNVYNLSAMERGQAEAMIAAREGRLCVRFFKREDGTVVTADCSAIRQAARRVKRTMVTVAAGIFAVVTGILGLQMARAEDALVIPDGNQSNLRVNREVKGEMAVMGDVAMPMPPQPPVPAKVDPPATAPATRPK